MYIITKGTKYVKVDTTKSRTSYSLVNDIEEATKYDDLFFAERDAKRSGFLFAKIKEV